MAVVNDVNLVTIAMENSLLGVRNSPLIIFIIIITFVDCYCYYLLQLVLSAILLPIWG